MACRCLEALRFRKAKAVSGAAVVSAHVGHKKARRIMREFGVRGYLPRAGKRKKLGICGGVNVWVTNRAGRYTIDRG